MHNSPYHTINHVLPSSSKHHTVCSVQHPNTPRSSSVATVHHQYPAVSLVRPRCASKQQSTSVCTSSNLQEPQINTSTGSSSSSSGSTPDKFTRGLQLLSDWQQQYGNCHVPKTATDASTLHHWVSSTRKAGRAGQLTQLQQQQLDQLGFAWKPNVVRACEGHSLPFTTQPTSTCTQSV
jgi:hypothetical protein